METPDIASVSQSLQIRRRNRKTELKIVEEDTPSGKTRWRISGLYVNGKRKREYFTSLDSARLRLDSLMTAETNTGTLAKRIAMRPDYAADAGRAADLIAPFDVTLLDVAREYVECRKALDAVGASLLEVVHLAVTDRRQRKDSIGLEALGIRFFDDLENQKLSKSYWDDLRKRWRRLCEYFGGDAVLHDVTPARIKKWLAGLPVADLTKGHFHRVGSAFFSYAVHEGLADDNPFRKVRKPKVAPKDEVAVFTPAQMRQLLDSAKPEWLPCLAIGGFAGLRPDEILRLDWKDVNLRAKVITVRPSTSKTANRRLVRISPNLRQWLTPLAHESGRICGKRAMREMRLHAREKLAIDAWPVDVLRHSFASYHLAAHRDINSTALEMGHRGTAMLFTKYREAVKPVTARAWWALRPVSAPKKPRKKKSLS